jgi:type IVB pilus formation R64 PilN family outer membrane protein
MMGVRLSIALSPLILLSACTGLAERINGKIGKADDKVSALVKDTGRTTSSASVKASPSVAYEKGIWLGKEVVKLGQPVLPSVFYEDATFDRTVASLSELAERISLRSRLPVKIAPDALRIAESGGNTSTGVTAGNAPVGTSNLPPNAMTAPRPGFVGTAPHPQASGFTTAPAPVRIYYTNGNFKGLLDTAAARFGVSWKYADGAIHFYHTDSRTFQISTLPGDSTFNATVASGATSLGGVTGSAGIAGSPGSPGGATGGAGGGISANNSQNTAVASRLSVYSSIESTVKSMVSAYGKVVTSPATGSITVVDTPDSLNRIAAYIDNENKTLSRQVVINVTVLSVTLSDAENYGINWNLVYNNLRQQYGMTSALPVSLEDNRFSAGVVGSSRFAGSTAIINALSTQGKVRHQTTASVITLNNQPVPVQVAKQTSYLQSSQTTVVSQVGTTTTLVPGSVTSGFNMSILPHVLTNGTVLLQFSTDISSLRQIREVQSGTSKIESPEIDTRNFLQRVAMKSNETLIISGFEQTDDNLDRQGVGDAGNYALGGGFKAGSNKESIVILITPRVLTEE